MSGWNIIYGLINFAILAAALFFIGRGIVKKGYRDHREKVKETLARAEESVKNAVRGAQIRQRPDAGEHPALRRRGIAAQRRGLPVQPPAVEKAAVRGLERV